MSFWEALVKKFSRAEPEREQEDTEDDSEKENSGVYAPLPSWDTYMTTHWQNDADPSRWSTPQKAAEIALENPKLIFTMLLQKLQSTQDESEFLDFSMWLLIGGNPVTRIQQLRQEVTHPWCAISRKRVC